MIIKIENLAHAGPSHPATQIRASWLWREENDDEIIKQHIRKVKGFESKRFSFVP
jgi:hypothetical protein